MSETGEQWSIRYRHRQFGTLGNEANIITRGRIRAGGGAQLQLDTLSTRIALYTRCWHASPGVLTPWIMLSALSRLS